MSEGKVERVWVLPLRGLEVDDGEWPTRIEVEDDDETRPYVPESSLTELREAAKAAERWFDKRQIQPFKGIRNAKEAEAWSIHQMLVAALTDSQEAERE